MSERAIDKGSLTRKISGSYDDEIILEISNYDVQGQVLLMSLSQGFF